MQCTDCEARSGAFSVSDGEGTGRDTASRCSRCGAPIAADLHDALAKFGLDADGAPLLEDRGRHD